MPLAQKVLLGLTILAVLALLAFLRPVKRFAVDVRRRDSLLLEMITNVSSGLDRLDNEFGGIATQTELIRNRLKQLIIVHRENLLVCATLLNKRQNVKGGSKVDEKGEGVVDKIEGGNGAVTVRSWKRLRTKDEVSREKKDVEKSKDRERTSRARANEDADRRARNFSRARRKTSYRRS